MSRPRIGIGTDLHRMVHGRPCILAGVEIESPVGPIGHSDGDAVLHAVCDALLGAAGLDDLGTVFPDTDKRWKDCPSDHFVKEAMLLIGEKGLVAYSLDIVLQLDRPKIAAERPRMRKRLAELLGLAPDRVNIKGKTLEGVGGKGESVSVTAVVLLGDR